ncbi:DNA recombination protein RmuC [Microvirga massiliensis]|uniref:DNA recombination protein RmuC n=1 Tax=Microvirga massiliensis TaxID=1033741 RepID=UPI00069B37A4|nr:DNA recombination protein RmuC [Microvirga massiliensis]
MIVESFPTNIVLIAIAACAVLTLILAVAIFSRVSRTVAAEPLTRDMLALALRTEADGIRRAGEDQSRGLRQELSEYLTRFQETTINSFRVLGDAVNTHIHGFGERLDASVKTIEQRVAAIGEKLNTDMTKLSSDASQNREGLRLLIEGKLDASVAKQAEEAKSLREELGSSFLRLGGNMATTLSDLGQQQKERLEQTAQALGLLSEKHEKAQEALRQVVEGRLDVLRQENSAKLDEMRKTVDEKLQSTLETRLGESFNRVVEQLHKVHEGLGEMKSLATNVGDLRNVLTNVKVRGTFGEVQLEMLLEQFLSREQYVKAARVKENSSEHVEFAIKLPGKGEGEAVLLPIDAKFPRETYERLVEASEAGDVAAVAQFRKQLEAQVKACAKEICQKYINPPTTTDFALMFLPTEGLYAEVLRQVGLFESVQREHKVTIAGPSTLSAILNALQMGFRTLAIEKRSSEVWHLLAAVQTEFGKYNDVVDRIAKQLDTASTTVQKLGQRTRVMNNKLRRVEALPDGTDASLMLGLTPARSRRPKSWRTTPRRVRRKAGPLWFGGPAGRVPARSCRRRRAGFRICVTKGMLTIAFPSPHRSGSLGLSHPSLCFRSATRSERTRVCSSM